MNIELYCPSIHVSIQYGHWHPEDYLLTSHWHKRYLRVGRSKGGAKDTCSLRVQILSFSCSLRQKFKIIG